MTSTLASTLEACLLKQETMRIFSSIVVAVDGSPSSRAALDLACTLLTDAGQMTIVHVDETQTTISGRHVQIVPESSELRRAGIAALAEARERARLDYSIEASVASVEGNPADMVIQTAERTNADTIVMGSRGLSVLKQLLLGSVTEGVVRQSSRPVVIVHVPTHDHRSP